MNCDWLQSSHITKTMFLFSLFKCLRGGTFNQKQTQLQWEEISDDEDDELNFYLV